MRVWLTISLVAFAAVAFFWGRRSTLSSVGGKSQALHSRPSHYGLYVALWSTLPALIVLVGWLVLEGSWLNAALRADSAADIQSLPEERTELFLRDAHALLDGDAVSRQHDPALEAAAARLGELRSQSNSILLPTLLILALGGFGWSVSRLSPSLRARQSVEATLKAVSYTHLTLPTKA